MKSLLIAAMLLVNVQLCFARSWKARPRECRQRTNLGQCCFFPFVYNGTEYNSCTTAGHGKPWCSLTAIFDVSRMWDECSSDDCRDPGSPANGQRLGYSLSPGSHVFFRCHVGYELIGSESRTCQKNRTWSGTQPMCRIVDCGAHSSHFQGYIKGDSSTTFSSKVRFRCYAGFVLIGPSERVCQADGKWSGEEPVCRAKRPVAAAACKDSTAFNCGHIVTSHPKYCSDQPNWTRKHCPLSCEWCTPRT